MPLTCLPGSWRRRSTPVAPARDSPPAEAGLGFTLESFGFHPADGAEHRRRAQGAGPGRPQLTVRQQHRLHVSASPGRPVSFVELDRAQDLIRQEVGKP
jgi:hypothetical protein